MDRDEVINKVTDIVCEMLGKEASEVKLESSFVDDLGADSLDTVELVMQLEEEFDLTIVDDDAENISTVQEACGLYSYQQLIFSVLYESRTKNRHYWYGTDLSYWFEYSRCLEKLLIRKIWYHQF